MIKALTFADALQAGIRREADLPRNAQAMFSCQGLRSSERGLVGFHDINQPISDAEMLAKGVNREWPWPQLLRLKGITLLADDQTLWEVDETDWSLTELSLYNLSYGAATITAGGPWHAIDFVGTWMLFNGQSVVFKMGYSTNVFCENSVTVLTGCDWHEGRAVYGGFNPADQWTAAWRSLLASYQGKIPAEVAVLLSTNGADENWVWFSTIGGGDLLLLFSTEFAEYGVPWKPGWNPSTITTGYGPSKPYFHHILSRNQMGFLPMPWRGQVYRTLPLDTGAVVYGAGGISGIFNAQGGKVGVRDIQGFYPGVGIASRSAVGGGKEGHIFIDEGGELWYVSPDFKAERLGYCEIFADMLDNDIVVSYNPQYREFWIADGEESYLLAPGGRLTRAPQMPTMVSFASGGPIGITCGLDDDTVDLEFQEFDAEEMGAIWELSAIKLTTDTPSEWSVYVYACLKEEAATWTTFGPFTPDSRGVVKPAVSALKWKIRLTADDREDMTLSNVEAVITHGETKRSIAQWIQD